MPNAASSTSKATSRPASEILEGTHSRGYLPHIKAKGATYAVTFRLADTLPAEVLERIRSEREEITRRATAAGRHLTAHEEQCLAKLYTERVEIYLDAGHGACWLRNPDVAGMVAHAIEHFDGNRYELHAWVVMPNHVHVVLTPLKDHTLSTILHSWKSYTAHQVQQIAQAACLEIPRGEAFWQRESYDHLIRDEEDFARACEYATMNPVRVGLVEKPEDWPHSSAASGSGQVAV